MNRIVEFDKYMYVPFMNAFILFSFSFTGYILPLNFPTGFSFCVFWEAWVKENAKKSATLDEKSEQNTG